ncbi:MAG: polysaccharide deacetylase family protein [Oscillospiraceae bacterium]|nr:polysaccharide deacetylase family protein [Candidatus Ruminococcus equi]
MKKFRVSMLSFILAIVLTASCTVSFGAATVDLHGEESILGDADNGGNVDICDATLIQMKIAKIDNGLLGLINEFNSDADLDGTVSVTDATLIQRYLAHICNFDGTEYDEEKDKDTVVSRYAKSHIIEPSSITRGSRFVIKTKKYGSSPKHSVAYYDVKPNEVYRVTTELANNDTTAAVIYFDENDKYVGHEYAYSSDVDCYQGLITTVPKNATKMAVPIYSESYDIASGYLVMYPNTDFTFTYQIDRTVREIQAFYYDTDKKFISYDVLTNAVCEDSKSAVATGTSPEKTAFMRLEIRCDRTEPFVDVTDLANNKTGIYPTLEFTVSEDGKEKNETQRLRQYNWEIADIVKTSGAEKSFKYRTAPDVEKLSILCKGAEEKTKSSTTPPQKKPMFTLIDDDGYRESYTNLFPITQEYNIPLVIAYEADELPKGKYIRSQTIWYSELRKIVEAGGEAIGHSGTNAVTVTDEQNRVILQNTKANLKEFDFFTNIWCYPYGGNNEQTRNTTREYYDFAFHTTDLDHFDNHGFISNFHINRVPLGGHYASTLLYDKDGQTLYPDTFDYYKKVVDDTIENNGWLVLMCHSHKMLFPTTEYKDVGPSKEQTENGMDNWADSQYWLLRKVFDYIVNEKGYEFSTASEALEIFGNVEEQGDYLAYDNFDLTKHSAPGGAKNVFGETDNWKE